MEFLFYLLNIAFGGIIFGIIYDNYQALKNKTYYLR